MHVGVVQVNQCIVQLMRELSKCFSLVLGEELTPCLKDDLEFVLEGGCLERRVNIPSSPSSKM